MNNVATSTAGTSVMLTVYWSNVSYRMGVIVIIIIQCCVLMLVVQITSYPFF